MTRPLGGVLTVQDAETQIDFLHPTFPNPCRRVCSRGSAGQPFAITDNAWGTFQVRVEVEYRGGTSEVHFHDLDFTP